jgi:hypothetical protein
MPGPVSGRGTTRAVELTERGVLHAAMLWWRHSGRIRASDPKAASRIARQSMLMDLLREACRLLDAARRLP